MEAGRPLRGGEGLTPCRTLVKTVSADSVRGSRKISPRSDGAAKSLSCNNNNNNLYPTESPRHKD